MRMLDEINDVVVTNVLLMLTKDEALELRDSLENLFDTVQPSHEHIADRDYKHEITVAFYDEEIESNVYHERVMKLLRDDE